MNPPPISTPPPLPHLRSQNSAVAQMICWLVIIACSVLVFLSNHLEKAAPKKAAEGPSFQVEMDARLAVGWVEFMRALSGGKVDAKAERQMTESVRTKAKSNAEKFYAAIVVADVESTDAAKPMLEEVAASPDDQLAADAERILAAHGGESLSESEAERLKDRHGWIGKLAAVQGRGKDDPSRKEVVGPAIRSALVLLVFTGTILLALLIGIGLLVTAIVLLVQKQLRFAGVPPASFDSRLLEAFTVYLAITGTALAWGLLKLPGGRAASLVAMVASIVLAYMWPRWRGMSKAQRAAALGLSRGQGTIWEIGCGIVGYIALLPIVAAAFAVTLLLNRQFQTDSAHPISEMMTGPLWVFLLVAVMAVIYAPITEELFFRGAFFGFLRTRISWPIAAIIVGVIFAAIHPQGWAAIPLLGAIGVNLAILRHWRGSLVAPITAHALNNGTVMLMMALALR